MVHPATSRAPNRYVYHITIWPRIILLARITRSPCQCAVTLISRLYRVHGVSFPSRRTRAKRVSLKSDWPLSMMDCVLAIKCCSPRISAITTHPQTQSSWRAKFTEYLGLILVSSCLIQARYPRYQQDECPDPTYAYCSFCARHAGWPIYRRAGSSSSI